jgi:VanZ family protein
MTPVELLVRHRKIMLGALIFFWALALTLTHWPCLEIPSEVDVGDKWLHRTGFAGLTSLLMLTLVAYQWKRSLRLLLIPCTLAVYGVLDELTQPWFGRTCDIVGWKSDWMSDVLGMIVTLATWEVAIYIVERLRLRKSD